MADIHLVMNLSCFTPRLLLYAYSIILGLVTLGFICRVLIV